jgi:ABC-2 type transport system ATP-binding protein
MESAVSVRNLGKKFGDFSAVANVTLDVEPGEIFGFLGANGVGKTKTIPMLCGLLLPTEGEGQVSGYDIYSQTEMIKRSIGYMSQKFSLYSDLSGAENLEFYGSVYGLKPRHLRDRITELTERLQLSNFIDRSTASLPTGWRQRLALAAALLHRPEILFLDEPTGGVDPVFRRHFWELLYRLADAGTTLFVTTHYMDEAEFCRRISIMHRGRIIALGNPQEMVAEADQPDLDELFIKLIREQEPS